MDSILPMLVTQRIFLGDHCVGQMLNYKARLYYHKDVKLQPKNNKKHQLTTM